MGLFTTIAAMAGNAIMEKVMPEVKEKLKEKIDDAVDNVTNSIEKKMAEKKANDKKIYDALSRAIDDDKCKTVSIFSEKKEK